MTEKIQNQNDFFKLIIESLDYPFYIIDVDTYEVKMGNSASGFNSTSKKITCHSLTHNNDKPCTGQEHPCPLKIVKETKKPYITEHIHFNKSGNSRIFEVHGHPIFNKEGNVVQIIEYAIDISKRKQAEELIKEKEERYRSMLQSASDAIISSDNMGIIIDWNNGAEKIFGYSASEIIGKNITEIIPHRYHIQHNEGMKRVNKGGEHRVIGKTVELFGLHKNGKEFPVELSLAEWESSSDKYFTGIIRDITERKKAEEELKETNKALEAATAKANSMAAKAEKANAAKSDFLSNMSHEIRTPMNAIIGLSHLCLGTSLNFQQYDYIENVHQSGQLLLGIINNILDFSKIEAGKLKLESISFTLKDVLDKLNNMISIMAQEKGLEILFDIDPETPVHMVGDPLRFGQILLNLVGNAVKFTESGKIVIHIKPVQKTVAAVKLEIRVTDTGIGMTADQKSHLFEFFKQAEVSTARKFGGTGLGLAISKALIHQMKGQIWVESTSGQGSSFNFTIVFNTVSSDFKKETIKTKKSTDQWKIKTVESTKGAHILVAEDNKFNQRVIEGLLTQAGMKVTIANDGKEAVYLAEHTKFDIILMDIKMPEMDGYEATQIIKNTLKVQSPIIAITANAMAGDREKCLEVGMCDYIMKPIEPEILFKTLVKWIPENI